MIHTYYATTCIYVHTNYEIFSAWKAQVIMLFSMSQIYSNRVTFTCSHFSLSYIRELVLENKSRVSFIMMWDITRLPGASTSLGSPKTLSADIHIY